MSLAERVTSLETYDDEGRGSSPARDRRLSFNPVGDWTPAPMADHEPLGAFEVSVARRVLQVLVAVVYCLLSAGIVFGYAALKPVLIREGVYRDRCSGAELERGVRTCYEQELRLNLMFTVAAVVTNVCALLVGTILDRYGPRLTGVVGSVLFALGCVTFALAPQLAFDGYLTGYVLLALGGPFVFISSFQLSNTFPAHSGLILSMLTGAFDSSSAVFLFYRVVYAQSGARFKPKQFFLIYLVVPASIMVAQFLLMPKNSYKTVGELMQQAEGAEEGDDVDVDSRGRRESVVGEITRLLGPKGGDDHVKTEERKKERSGVWGALHGLSALEQIRSPWFVLITLFTVIQMTRINYFVATIRPQYEYLLGDYYKAVEINTFFDVALPLGGVIAVPLIGLLLDNTSTPFVLSLLVATAGVIGVLGMLPYIWAGYANVCLFVVYRPLYYTAVSDYSAKVFGFRTFGKVYGLIMCLGGLFNLSQAGLDALTYKVFNRDPRPVNGLLLGLALVVGVALVAYVWIRSRSLRRERLEDEAEGAAETLMPGAEAEEALVAD
ncbi:MAG: hypothetical protein M1832_005455 [Thelocarpon impressellum]|nr:MAG: hypothetical protein M1832_005455 [Thelocarpon impressellum]